MEKLGYDAFTVTSYPGGQLAGSDEEQFQMVMSGQIVASTAPASIVAQYCADASSLNVLDLPYMFTSDDAFYDYAQSELVTAALDTVLEQTGVRCLSPFIVGWRHWNKQR
ncbi:MAG: hypothetical protein V8R80_10990 [Eubacterium sp.]